MAIQRRSWKTKDVTLWTALILTIFLFVAIQFAACRSELTLLDGIASPSKAMDILDHMEQNQKNAHIWITATLDVAFPLSYGCLFAGSALRFFPEYIPFIALPALLAVIADLTEGVIQILALTNTYDCLDFKKYVTLFKFGMAILSFVIAIVGLGISSINHKRYTDK